MVSAAAGSVGHFVGQMAKILDCRVVGVCGNNSKCKRLMDELGFDKAVNYKQHSFREDLKQATPRGVDLYFDNTGGPILTSALFRLITVGGLHVVVWFLNLTPPHQVQARKGFLVCWSIRELICKGFCFLTIPRNMRRLEMISAVGLRPAN